MNYFSPERRAELIASAERKKRQAQIEIAERLSKMTPEQLNELQGFQFTYTLTLDEYRAMFD